MSHFVEEVFTKYNGSADQLKYVFENYIKPFDDTWLLKNCLKYAFEYDSAELFELSSELLNPHSILETYLFYNPQEPTQFDLDILRICKKIDPSWYNYLASILIRSDVPIFSGIAFYLLKEKNLSWVENIESNPSKCTIEYFNS